MGDESRFPPTKAPGLKRRPRKGDWVYYWMPSEKDIKAGYPIKSLPLDQSFTQEQRAKRCRDLQAELERWRHGDNGAARFSIRWLVNRYQSDEFSPYKNLRPRSARAYDQCLRLIEATVGERFIGYGNNKVPLLTGEDFRRWHKNWGLPDATGEPTAPSRARHLIVQLRTLFSYAVELGVPGAAESREMLSAMRFPTPRPRIVAPTREQVMALVDKAKELELYSIAATTLAQYLFIERRTHIIGRWTGDEWGDGWRWEQVSKDWVISYAQNKRGEVPREFNLVTVQPLLQLLQRTPKEERSGAIIKCELTKQPWREKHYTDTFRKVARAAGIPDTIWSMDMRAGGATEADSTPGITDRMLRDGGGWKTNAMLDRYRRERQENAQKVVEMREWARGSARADAIDSNGFAGEGVYFLQAKGGHGYVKIGFTTDLRNRLKDFTECPYPVQLIGFHYGPRPLELYLHKALYEHRVHGEWFRPTPQVLGCAKVLPRPAQIRFGNEASEKSERVQNVADKPLE